MDTKKPKLFWLEDDPDGLIEHLAYLRDRYEIEIGAHVELIEQFRQQPFDLTIVDLMIHLNSFMENSLTEVENLRFEGVAWRRTGLEFLKRLRKSAYKEFGFSPNIPVIVASAVANYSVQQVIEDLDVKSIIIKPFTIDEITHAIGKALID
jgi:CheY-like chemotaxis protein